MDKTARIAKAQQMHNEGASYRAIGRALGVASYTAHCWLNPEERARRSAKSRNYYATHKEQKKAYDTAYLAAHKEERKKWRAAYYAAHRDEAVQYAADYRAEHKEELDAWYAEHSEEEKVRLAAYYVEHKAAYKAYNDAHKEKRKAYQAAWTKENSDKANTYSAARRALRAGALIGATAAQISEIKEIYRRAEEGKKVRCYLCGNLIPKGHRHVDHIMPLSKGGAHRPSNLAVACDTCNLHKYAKLPYEVGVLI